MSKKQLFFLAGTLVVGLFFGFLWGRSVTPPTQIVSREFVQHETTAATTTVAAAPRGEAAAARTASLMIDYGDGRVRTYGTITVTKGETMLQLLEKQAQAGTISLKTKAYTGLGVLVESIGTKVNGDEGKYWQYWVNNVSIPYGANQYVVRPGDVIVWKFLHYK